MSGRMIDVDKFIDDTRKKYCEVCNGCNGIKCEVCWVSDMLEEIDNAPDAEVNAG